MFLFLCLGQSRHFYPIRVASLTYQVILSYYDSL